MLLLATNELLMNFPSSTHRRHWLFSEAQLVRLHLQSSQKMFSNHAISKIHACTSRNRSTFCRAAG